MITWYFGGGIVSIEGGDWVQAHGTAFPPLGLPQRPPPNGAVFWRTDYRAWYYFDKDTRSWELLEGTGEQGPQGDQGTQGSQGAQGADGTGSQGPQGADGGAGAQGAPGTPGAQGATGDPGPQGDDGTAGTQGPQGATGAGTQGPQGDVGAPGSQGNQGSQGADSTVQGPQGNQGNQGAVGAGTQGNQGNQGNAGSPGTQGNQGNQGNAGGAGSQGNQGDQGAAGAAGAGVQTEFSVQGNQIVATAQTVTNVFAAISVPTNSKWYYTANIGLQPAAGTQGVQVGIQCSVAGATVEGTVMGPQTATAAKQYRQAAQGSGVIPIQNVAGIQSVLLEGYIVAPGSGSPAIGVQIKGVQASQNWISRANAILTLSRVP